MNKKIKILSKAKVKAANNVEFKSDYKPKTYHSAFLNTVNKDARSSRPETVGKLASEIFPEFLECNEKKSPESWKEYYLKNYSDCYEKGLRKLKEKVEAERIAINNITEQDVEDWYDDLMFNKTFAGLHVQNEILETIATEENATYRKPTAAEEGRGIDGYIDDVPYSVKAESYREKIDSKQEKIQARMVFYRENEKTKCIEYYVEEEE